MKKLTTNDWIIKARQFHGNKYDYSKVNYIDAKTKVCIICPEHGEFWQTPDAHARKNKAQGCPKCKIENLKEIQSLTPEEFTNRANKIHNNFYTYDNCNYVSMRSIINITCPIHGKFSQLASNHISGKGCLECGKLKTSNKLKLSQEDYINRVKKLHPDYNYSETIYTGMTNSIKYVCPKHGVIEQNAADHYYSEAGCPKCNQSKGENLVARYLDINNVNYIQQYKVEVPENIRKSKYIFVDFYLPEYNCFIEYNGIQHYNPVKQFGGKLKFEEQKIRDLYLKEYCNINNINLLEIPYNTTNIAKDLRSIIKYRNKTAIKYFGDIPPKIDELDSETFNKILWVNTNNEKCTIIPEDFFYKLLDAYTKINKI